MVDKLEQSNTAIDTYNNIEIDLSSFYKDSIVQKIEIFQQAIEDCKIVTFEYYSKKGMSKRNIEPYTILFRWASWYIHGFCVEKQAFRIFKFNRLSELNVLERTFIKREIPSIEDSIRDFYPNKYKAKFLFDESVKFRLVDEYGSCFEERANGLYVELGFINYDYMITWILGYGDKVTVLEPKELREDIKKIIEKIGEKYK